MRRAIPALLIAIAAALAVAACGGDDPAPTPTKAEYKQDFQKLTTELVTVGGAVGAAINGSGGKSNKELAKTFSKVADQTEEIAGKFDDLTPPDNATIQQQQAKLVAGLRLAADDLNAISKAAGKKDLKAAGEAAAKLTRDNAGVAAPRAAIEKELGIKAATTPTQTTTPKQK